MTIQSQARPGPLRVLYICTHNRCRSILAEAITRQLAGDLVVARSAGSQPEGQVSTAALTALQKAGYDTGGLRSKSWQEMEDYNPDLSITLCDSAAGESCPVWLESCKKLHWGLQDPSAVTGDEQAVDAAFAFTIAELENRIRELLRRVTGA